MRYLLASLLIISLSSGAWADEAHDRARQALREGKALPLATIIERVQAVQPGDILEVELEDERGRLIYEVKVIDQAGKVVKLMLDASSGEVIEKKGKSK